MDEKKRKRIERLRAEHEEWKRTDPLQQWLERRLAPFKARVEAENAQHAARDHS
jgi:hypothetical protein